MVQWPTLKQRRTLVVSCVFCEWCKWCYPHHMVISWWYHSTVFHADSMVSIANAEQLFSGDSWINSNSWCASNLWCNSVKPHSQNAKEKWERVGNTQESYEKHWCTWPWPTVESSSRIFSTGSNSEYSAIYSSSLSFESPITSSLVMKDAEP